MSLGIGHGLGELRRMDHVYDTIHEPFKGGLAMTSTHGTLVSIVFIPGEPKSTHPSFLL